MSTIEHEPSITFPEARYFAVTWGIPDGYGGMTSALLHRSRAFEALGGRPVDILTFDTRVDYPRVTKRLRDAGELLPRSRVINVWDWWRENPLPVDAPGTLSLSRDAFTPLADDAALETAEREGKLLSRLRRAPDGVTVLQIDHYRADGTLAISDRRDTIARGIAGGRSIVLCDAAGKPLRSWKGAWAFYRYWLDRLCAGTPAIMIVDSKTSANFMVGYRRKKVLTVHLVHSSHLEGEDSNGRELKASRRAVFEQLDGFDSVVVLTPRQKSDIQRLLGSQAGLTVVPNSRDLSSFHTTDAPRPAQNGIVIASLSGRKRVEHAIRATVAAAKRAPLTLDIYGEGPRRPAIERLIDELDAAQIVRLHGHSSEAKGQLEKSSFMVLSSTSEGFPLVLVESLAAGCIPIVYDIPYGPADAIEDGKNGFLVPAGDVDGLTRAILRLQEMPETEVERMRQRARRTAAQYSDVTVTQLWARELAAACRRKGLLQPSPTGGMVSRLRRRIPVLHRGSAGR